jgi:histidinol-phosphatase (PHP family)
MAIKPMQFDLYDMHVHSSNSHDSTTPVTESAEHCLKKGIRGFAVCDHFDVQYHDTLDIVEVVSGSVRDAQNAAKQFEGRVKVLRGIEIGEGIWNEDVVRRIMSLHEFDVVLGSVHAVRYKDMSMPYSKIDFGVLSKEIIEEYLDLYFDELMETVEKIPCDIISHLTCPLRYINGKYGRGIDMTKFEGKIERGLGVIIDKSLALEVNTSSDEFLMPDEWIIKKYAEMGGRIVTLGSDAHVSANVGKDFENTIKVLKKYGFGAYYYFENRTGIPCKI